MRVRVASSTETRHECTITRPAGGVTVCEAMVTSGGSERGGTITGSIWGDPLYAPFGRNETKECWFTGGK